MIYPVCSYLHMLIIPELLPQRIAEGVPLALNIKPVILVILLEDLYLHGKHLLAKFSLSLPKWKLG